MRQNTAGKKWHGKQSASMRVALVYDRINKWGGAERVLLALHNLFPDAPLYTAVYNPQTAQWADVFSIKTSFLQYIPFAKSHHEWFGWLTPLAFETFDFNEYDLVISATSADAKGIITRPHTRHICICLTPTRYLWSHFDEYFKHPILRFFSTPVVWYLKNWDRIAATRPDDMVAISDLVKKRIKKYYKRDSVVIFPPTVVRSSLQAAPLRPSTDRDDMRNKKFYLVVSRLVPYKKIDLAIGACNGLQQNLVIIGHGSDEARLRQIAGPTVTFLSDLTDEELAWYYQHSDGLIMPQEEDFGLVSVEAQSYGTPVITYAHSGAAETIIPGKTGELFKNQTIETLSIVLKNFSKSDYDANDCKQNAERFSFNRFEKEILNKIRSI